MYFETRNDYIEDILNRVGDKLQLNKSRYEKIESSYKDVAEWLNDDDGLFQGIPIDIYPQGSYRIGTTVRPIKNNEFDLDFVIEPKKVWDVSIDAVQVLKHLESRLKQNENYKPRLQVMKRCVRLNYEDYHMDILPGFPYKSIGSLDLKVPDKKLQDWKDSSPIKYGDWFISQTKLRKSMTLLEKAAKIEPLPEILPYEEKEPLQRAVQILKRYRDIYFLDNNDIAPISIVLTTLAGRFYSGESTAFEALTNIIIKIANEIDTTEGFIEVKNPVNNNENFSEKWDIDPTLYMHFKSFITDFKKQIHLLHKSNGIDEAAIILKNILGVSVTNSALVEQVDFINKQRESGKLGIWKSNGRITTVTSGIGSGNLIQPSKQHNFYGGKN